MGNEATCNAAVNGKTARGTALLETTELVFRGDGVKLRVPFSSIVRTSILAKSGTLSLRYNGGSIRLDLGADAEKWAEKIKNPKGRLDKLGVKEGQLVCVLAVHDATFISELTAKGARVATKMAKDADQVFLGVRSSKDLASMKSLAMAMTPAGSLWVIRPKGAHRTGTDVSEKESMKAGADAGLVDVKVVAFSATHTAEKYVIPVAKRPATTSKKPAAKAAKKKK